MEIELSSHFIRQTRKLSAKEQIMLSEKIELFRKSPVDPRLKVHPLTGKLKGLLAFSLTYSKRVVFRFLSPESVLLLDVGTHDEVYR